LPESEGRLEPTLEGLVGVQSSLRARFDDFRQALSRRDEEAYRVALADFEAALRRWTIAGERVVGAASGRAPIPGPDPSRELRLEYVQLRELARYLLALVTERAPIADVLGLAENLSRRLDAHERDLEEVYYPACAPLLTPDEWRALAGAAPPR
jgi:hypothetical protein